MNISVKIPGLLSVLFSASVYADEIAMKNYWSPVEDKTGPVVNRKLFPDERKAESGSKCFGLADGLKARVDRIAKGMVRVRVSKRGIWTESGLNRYSILHEDAVPDSRTIDAVAENGCLFIVEEDGRRSAFSCKIEGDGFAVSLPLTATERVYGLGDAGRENLNRRGGCYRLWIRNQTCDIPVPVVMTSEGRGLFLNSTWRNTFDVGKTDPGLLTVEAEQGDVDFYVFSGRDGRELMSVYTALVGRPKLLPITSYGFTFICNKWIDQHALVTDAVKFRELGIPCSTLGLEGWMSRRYDFRKDKDWNPQRFNFPYWATGDRTELTWIGALRRLGFNLSLWMCTDYDFSAWEEGDRTGKWTGADAEEHWFKHLEKFCDDGAGAFKLDACAQFSEYPDRKWANGMADLEMHNLYPVLYTKAMVTGYEKHTGRRAMINSAGGYAGFAQFAASWAGDTGGEKPSLLSVLNLAFSGHSNHSCDMSVDRMDSLHFACLSPWAQQNNWDFWFQPWLLGKERQKAVTDYLKLRYRLLPYIYTAAAEASRTGWPLCRALAMECPEDPSFDAATGTYFFGPDLLVTAFDEEAVYPKGVWYDFFTGEKIVGPARRKNPVTKTRGGSLAVRAGAIIPSWPDGANAARGWNEKVELLVWPHEGNGETRYTLYEDDGISLGHLKGECSRTEIIATTRGGKTSVSVGERRGSFAGAGKVEFAVREVKGGLICD